MRWYKLEEYVLSMLVLLLSILSLPEDGGGMLTRNECLGIVEFSCPR